MTDNLLTTEIETPAENRADTSGKPENVPEKFWDGDKKEIRTDALLSSYVALEKRFSKMVPVPETDDDKKRHNGQKCVAVFRILRAKS